MKAFKYAILSSAAVFSFSSLVLAEGGSHDISQSGSQQQMQHERGQMGQPGQVKSGQQQESRARFGEQKAKLDRDKVMQIQRKLNEQQQANLKEDGVWGKKTSDALRRYQQKEGLSATGQPSDETLSRLGIEHEQGQQQ